MLSLIEQEKDRLKKLNKKDLALMFYKSVMLEFRINKFINSLRKRVLKKKEMMKNKSEKEEKEAYLRIDENERLVREV